MRPSGSFGFAVLDREYLLNGRLRHATKQPYCNASRPAEQRMLQTQGLKARLQRHNSTQLDVELS